jgi:hypothetical protein
VPLACPNRRSQAATKGQPRSAPGRDPVGCSKPRHHRRHAHPGHVPAAERPTGTHRGRRRGPGRSRPRRRAPPSPRPRCVWPTSKVRAPSISPRAPHGSPPTACMNGSASPCATPRSTATAGRRRQHPSVPFACLIRVALGPLGSLPHHRCSAVLGRFRVERRAAGSGSSVMASACRGRQVRNPWRASGEEARRCGRFRMRISARSIGLRGFSGCGRRVLRASRDCRAWCCVDQRCHAARGSWCPVSRVSIWSEERVEDAGGPCRRDCHWLGL